jgi:mono/diheme cytochrome c family protein
MATRSNTPLRLFALLLFLVVTVETAYLAWPFARDIVMPPHASAAQRGRELAERLGCFTCHGPGGTGGVRNPGSEAGEVPSFHEGTIMMYAHDDEDLRQYILDGAPAKKLARPAYVQAQEAQALRMPAFRSVVGAADVDLLVAYLRATSGLLGPAAEPAAHGAELAAQNGCFACHGPLGAGGLPNPGSLKGYIPGFGGEDFDELVESDDELRAWIADGGIPRLRNDAAARFFLNRQRVQMPAFGKFLAPGDVDALMAYVRWIAAGEWKTMGLHEAQ